ncbi:IPP transferase [Novipirellula galeiformis]|uniref:tRNA dimethylallyltransferase n=1 Tax=Novipirellula galeiformis TaxID=2528004 RepID=A0A5C6CCS3_9BACT|nr:tRNA (adenosine(37)-N6)-dimethylallyltransferase MiaA [Novipirellula galeiformis]TWU22008.1 IPP transferase [Novipirellula galeiformis]
MTERINVKPETFPPLVDRAIIITGPTASGKSAVAIELARLIGGEILSLDSIAVYRGMDIGSAKPTREDCAQIPHHLIDLVDPNDEFSVVCYLKAAHAIVDRLEAERKPAIFVGGTPMFLKGVLRGFDPGPPADEAFRHAVQQDVERFGVDALRKRLRQVDPLAAHRIDPGDVRRMIRALEVAYQTGQPLSHRQLQFDEVRDASSCNVFRLGWDRKVLHERINRRVEQMFARGFVDEVRSLTKQYGVFSKTAAQAVGYRELLECLSQHGDLETTKQEIAAHTRQMARRQETWFRSFRELRSLQLNEPIDACAIAASIQTQLVAASRS